MRSATEVARRALTLSAVVSVAYGDSRETVAEWLRRESLWSELSPRELAFMTTAEPARKEVIALTWHVERLVPVLWVIQKIPVNPPLTSQCDTELIKCSVVWPPSSTKPFITTAVLRSRGEIEDEYEKLYHSHWRVRDARLKNLPPPDGLDADVTFERHWSFNWVIGNFRAWDDITTNT